MIRALREWYRWQAVMWPHATPLILEAIVVWVLMVLAYIIGATLP